MRYILIAFGGALGAVTRILSSELITSKISSSFIPLGILSVNLLGCFFLGIVLNTLLFKQFEFYQSFFMLGFLGAFTTFSAFSRETLDLISQGLWASAISYILISAIGCLFATWLGLQLSAK